MKRWLALAALLTSACDDAEVTAKALDVLEHGLVAARLSCNCTGVANPPATTVNQPGQVYRALKLIDGSCSADNSSTSYWSERSEAEASLCPSGSPAGPRSLVEGGVLKVFSSSTGLAYTADASACCTGFNLEAFGVE